VIKEISFARKLKNPNAIFCGAERSGAEQKYCLLAERSGASVGGFGFYFSKSTNPKSPMQ
jgi:hypothetical protein